MVEIYFRDLTKEKQKELLEVFGVNDAEEANWDCQPLAIVETDDDDDWEEEDDEDFNDDDDDCK